MSYRVGERGVTDRYVCIKRTHKALKLVIGNRSCFQFIKLMIAEIAECCDIENAQEIQFEQTSIVTLMK